MSVNIQFILVIFATMDKNKVVYIHKKATDGTIFYVGIGKPSRAKQKEGRNRYWEKTVAKHGYTIDIVEKNLTWDEACESEIALIELIGRRDLGLGSLVNLTDGGEGAYGYISVRRIQVIDLNNGKIYKSITEASKLVKMTNNHLVNCVNGKENMKRASHLRAIDTDGTIKWKSEDDEGMVHKEFVYKKYNWVEMLAYDLDSIDSLNNKDLGIVNRIDSKTKKENRLRKYISDLYKIKYE